MTFTNMKHGSIIVDKVTSPAGDSQEFEFTTNYGEPFKLSDTSDPEESGLLEPGTYSVAESPVAGWDMTGAVCSDGSPVNAIDLSPGETVTVTFTNTKHGSIIVDKVTSPAGDPQEFEFTTNYGEPFKLSDTSDPKDSGLLEPGTYW